MDKYEDMVYNLSLRYTKSEDEAEDITQEVFLKIYECLSTFKGESQLSTWIYRIAQNEIIQRHRKSEKQSTISHENIDQIISDYYTKLKQWRDSISPEVILLKEEMNSKIRSLVANLPKDYKNPLILFYFENMSYKEISEKLNLKMNTLKSYIFRGKELMKEWLKNESDK